MARRVGLCLVVAVLTAVQARADTPKTLKALLHFHQCPLVPQLQAVYARPGKVGGRAPFTTVTVAARPQSFVQCMFPGRKSVYCEASAFRSGPASSKTPLPSAAVAALQQLGFVPQPDGHNLVVRRTFRGEPDFDAIAVLMLTALHDAYGVRADTPLETFAPFAGDLVTVCRR